MSFAIEMAKMARELLSEFDERECKMQLIVAGEATFDEALGEDVISPSVSYDLIGVSGNYDEASIDGTAIRSTDLRLSVVCEVEPTQKDNVEMDGGTFSIVNVRPVAYTGKDKTVMYRIQVRK